MSDRRRRARAGASIVEVMVGLFVIIPLFLCLIDLSAIVLGQITNDALAKRAARAAAHEKTPALASGAAQQIVNSFNVTGIVSEPELISIDFNSNTDGNVHVVTKVLITIPAPVPFVPLLARSREMRAQASEPIVVLPATVEP